MQKITIILLTLLYYCTISNAQSIEYIAKLESILHGSIQEKAITAAYTSDSSEYRLGRNPVDPKFEISYFFENRFEANLSTELEIPSVYRQRNRISSLNINKAESLSRLQMQEQLLQLSDKYLELICNMKIKEFISKLTTIDTIEFVHKSISKALENGDITMLDYTDLEMILKTITGTYQTCELNIQALTREIQTYNKNFTPAPEDFPQFGFQDLSLDEFIRKAYDNSPMKEIFLTDSLILEKELKLAKLQWAPKIVVGARLDMDENSKFAPAAIGGITLPLWENRGNIKHSKAKITAYSLDRESKETELITEFQNLYSNYMSTSDIIANWKEFDINQYASTLRKAYQVRRITASEYYLKFANLINNAYYLFGLYQDRAAYAARIAILMDF